MADTGEDREISKRINANQAERVAEAKKLVEKLKRSPQPTTRRKPKKHGGRPKPRT